MFITRPLPSISNSLLLPLLPLLLLLQPGAGIGRQPGVHSWRSEHLARRQQRDTRVRVHSWLPLCWPAPLAGQGALCMPARVPLHLAVPAPQ